MIICSVAEAAAESMRILKILYPTFTFSFYIYFVSHVFSINSNNRLAAD